jgi:hypothetical protein
MTRNEGKIMRAILISAALATASIPHHAKADFYSGNELYARCTGETYSEMSLCQGYVAGVWDRSDVDKVCPATNARLGQIVDVVKNYLRDRPEDRHFAAESLAVDAFEKAFCK